MKIKEGGVIMVSKSKLPITEAIKLLENGEITPQDFLENLSPRLKSYWNVILGLLQKHRVIRNVLVAKHLPFTRKFTDLQKKNFSRGILSKFVEWGFLTFFRTEDGHLIYFCNLPGFYTSEELLNLVPQKFQKDALRPFNEHPDEVFQIRDLEFLQVNSQFIEELINAFVQKGLLVKIKGGYKLAPPFRHLGASLETLKTLDLIKTQTLLLEEQIKKGVEMPPTDLKEVEKAVKKDLEKKMVEPLIVTTKDNPFKIAFIGEVRLGNQFTDMELLNWSLKMLEKFQPHFVVVSDLVQGDFRRIQVERKRTLTRESYLDRIEVQHRTANLILQALEKIAKEKVIYQLSDDDWQVAYNRAIEFLITLQQVRKATFSWLGQYFPEQIKRLVGEEYYRFMKFQWEVIQPYMYRIGRSLYNAEEVEELIGERISELFLINLLLLCEEFNLPIPEKYKEVVDFEALHGDKVGSKRIVTPDPLVLDLTTFGNKKIQAVHNIAFSDITQYIDSGFIPEAILRHLQAQGKETPYLLVDFHQERFWGTKLYNTFFFNLPGCQNPMLSAEGKIKFFHSRVLSDKAHRQITFRKEPPTPGIVSFEIFKDGRLRFRVLTNRIKKIIEQQKNEPEKTDLVLYTSDYQFGSISMRPEWVIKLLDYGLFSRKATHLIINGDVIQGFCYPLMAGENRPKRLVSVDSQKAFAREVLRPLFPAPNLEAIDLLAGNHESDIWGADITGQNNLEFLFYILDELYCQERKFNSLEKYPDIKFWSRIRLMKSAQPGGSTLNCSYGSRVLKSGFKYAVQHKWYPKGGGRTPLHAQIKWLKNIAQAAGDLDVLFGGHKHTFWVGLIAEKLMLQLPGLVDQSSFEFIRGFMPQSLGALIEFSNKEGIIVELVPIEFIESYRCISPFYSKINKELERPKPGTREYQLGFDSPWIQKLEEEINTFYQQV